MMIRKHIPIDPPARQRVWGWPAVVVFTLGGFGAGFYVMSALEALIRNGMHALSLPVPFGILGAAISGAGFLAVAAESGRPSRSLYITLNIRSAWISREVVLFGLFITLAIMNKPFPSAFLFIASILMATCFVISQGFIVFRSRAVAPWNVPVMPLLFLISGLMSGYGGILLVAALGYLPLYKGLFTLGIVVLFFHAGIWLIYLFGIKNDDFVLATGKLRQPGRSAFDLIISFLGPLMLLYGMTYASGGNNLQVGHTLAAITGSIILFSTIVEKFTVLRSIGILRGVAL